jgi:hypothetical protein
MKRLYAFFLLMGFMFTVHSMMAQAITPSDEQGNVNASIILAKKQTGKLQYWNLHEQHPTM